MEIKKVGIIGAGQMGSGIAHVVALAGYDVTLHDRSPQAVQDALARIDCNMGRRVAKQTITSEQHQQALLRIKTCDGLEKFANHDLIMEAIVEDEKAKCTLFEQLSKIMKPEAIMATNTSSISITRLAACSGRPEQFLGMHFMNPVPLMELVELIRGIATEDPTFNTARQFVKSLGKIIAVSEDFPAFMVNRILMPMINEAIYVLYEGVGSVHEIDRALVYGAHHPMGPLQLADFIGLDTCLSIMQVLYEGLGDSKYRPCPLLVKYVEAGWLGKKVERGFYDYRGEEPVPTR